MTDSSAESDEIEELLDGDRVEREDWAAQPSDVDDVDLLEYSEGVRLPESSAEDVADGEMRRNCFASAAENVIGVSLNEQLNCDYLKWPPFLGRSSEKK